MLSENINPDEVDPLTIGEDTLSCPWCHGSGWRIVSLLGPTDDRGKAEDDDEGACPHCRGSGLSEDCGPSIPPSLSLIVAADRRGLIGAGGKLPWPRLPADLARFRSLTRDRVCIVGRRTYDTLPSLPGRRCIVLSREVEGRTDPLSEALGLAGWLGLEPVVIGGAEVYTLTLPRTTRIYLTRIEAEFTGDTWFPGPLPPAGWDEVEREHRPADSRNAYPMTFTTWERGTT